MITATVCEEREALVPLGIVYVSREPECVEKHKR